MTKVSNKVQNIIKIIMHNNDAMSRNNHHHNHSHIHIHNHNHNLDEMQSKNIIVYLPIDLTYMYYYKQPPQEFNNYSPTKAQNDIQEFNPQSFNLHSPNINIDSTVHDDSKIIFIDKQKKYTKNITKLISVQYYYKYTDPPIPTDVCNICCWYCSDKIQTVPCGIPVKYENCKFYVKGFFCDFNCALSYNFYSNEFETVIQERESLIRMLYKVCHPNGNADEVTYAPIRESLKIFGGTLSYEEFHKNNKTVNFITQPMVPLMCFIEENYPENNFNNG